MNSCKMSDCTNHSQFVLQTDLRWNLLKQKDSFTLYVITLTEIEWTISRLTKYYEKYFITKITF
jgi:hypothetical protein